MRKFEDLEIWQNARIIVNEISKLMENYRDYGFKDQIQRASVSIMNNIAEGFERNSKKDFILFLRYAKGSCGEVRNMSYLAEDFSYIATEKAEELRNNCRKISSGIASLQRYLAQSKNEKT